MKIFSVIVTYNGRKWYDKCIGSLLESSVSVVTTSIGVEGIPFSSNEHCVIADNAEDFINAIISLNDSMLREKIIKNAFDVVNNMFSFENMRMSRIEILKKLY